MSRHTEDLDDTGLEVVDLDSETGFKDRPVRPRRPDAQVQGILRIYDAFLDAPDNILQAMVEAAAELCAADSAGISFEMPNGSDDKYWNWVAVTGALSSFANSILPRHPSACNVCIDRGRPQLLRVTERFYEIMGISAPPVTDGILLPWNVDGTRGTIWVMAHGRETAFDSLDLQTMQSLAHFAALAWRHHRGSSEAPREAAALALAVEVSRLVHQQLEVLADVLDLTNAIGVAQRRDAPGKQGKHGKDQQERLDGLVKLLALSGSGRQVN